MDLKRFFLGKSCEMKTIFKPTHPQHHGNNLRRLMRLLNIAPKELMNDTGYSQQMITYYLKAETIHTYALRKIAVAMGIKPMAITKPNLLNQVEAFINRKLKEKK